jgi:hypothetical protein
MAASEFGQSVSRDAGLLVGHGETPTHHQAAMAALHGREDAAAVFMLSAQILGRQRQLLWWLRVVAALLVLLLFK